VRMSLSSGLNCGTDTNLKKMSHSPEKEELSKLVDAYSENRINRGEFLLFAKEWIPEQKLKSLLMGLDEGRVTKEEFLLWGIPHVAVIPHVDFLDAFATFEETKKDLMTPNTIRTYGYLVKPFLLWLIEEEITVADVTESVLMRYIHAREEERGKKYATGTVSSISRHVKAFFSWMYDERRIPFHPLARLKVKEAKGSPEIFNIAVEKGLLVSSEVNPIYNTLYTHPDRFTDWRRLEIEIRILRESGLRPIHALRLEFQDIDLERKVIWYDRIKKYERTRKYMPLYETRISDILVKRLETYLKLHPEITARDRVFTEFDSKGLLDKLKHLRKVGEIPHLYPYMFRYSFCTLIVCVLPKEEMWTEYTGDTPTTLRKHYARRLAVEYDEGGLSSYSDIINVVFNSEGLLEEEIPPKRRPGRPRKRQAFILP